MLGPAGNILPRKIQNSAWRWNLPSCRYRIGHNVVPYLSLRELFQFNTFSPFSTRSLPER